MKEDKCRIWINENKLLILGVLSVFVGIFVFFFNVQKVIPFDGDDWGYLYRGRLPIPIPGTWNPSRVFPEILQPFIGLLASVFVYPLTNDYLIAVSAMTSLAAAFFVAILFWQLYRLAFECSSDHVTSFFLSGFVIIAFFALFKGIRLSEGDSNYLLNTNNICCIFFYLIPNLLNSCLIIRILRWIMSGALPLHFSEKQNADSPARKNSSYLKSGFWGVLFYLGIFSMESSAALTAAFAFAVLLYIAVNALRQKGQKGGALIACKNIWAKGRPYIAICLIYTLSLALMMTGGRANWDDGHNLSVSVFSGEYANRIFQAAKALAKLCLDVNIIMTAIFVGVFAVKVSVYFLNRRDDKNNPLIMFIKFCMVAAAFYTVFIILVFAKANPDQAGRIDTSYGLFFLLTLSCFMGVIYVLSKYRQIAVLLPYTLILLFCVASNPNTAFVRQNIYSAYGEDKTYLSYDSRKALMDDLIAQVIEADENGLETMTLYLPKFDSSDNWPVQGTDFAITLYKAGVINSKIKVAVEYVEGYMPLKAMR